MIVVYKLETGDIVQCGNFDPTDNVPKDHGFVEDPDFTFWMMGTHRVDADGKIVSVAEIANEMKWNDVRRLRDSLLSETDFLAMPDYPLTSESRSALNGYRQALRDVTKSAKTSDDVVWPIYPVITKTASA